MEPVFFSSPALFRTWLSRNHASAGELLVGFHKVDSGKPSMTWPESVDQALCFGWIDGVRRSLGSESYVIRFTPRRSRSIWSAVNVRRANELRKLGLMRPPGLKVFQARDRMKTNRYSFEREHVRFSRAQTAEFRANVPAWKYFQSRPPGYRKVATWWVLSAKKEETKVRRLATLIADSALGRVIAPLRWAVSKK